MKNSLLRFFKLQFFAVVCSTACASSPYPKSDHYDGEKFFQPGAAPVKGFIDLLKWQFFGDKKEWPKFRENTTKPRVLIF